MSDFADLADAGRQLGAVMREAFARLPDPLVLAAIPNGVPVALGMRDAWPVAVRGLEVDRTGDGVVVHPPADVAGRDVIVVDDGVESGSVARAAAAALLDAGVASVSLAVPVCSRASLASLQHRFDQVVAVARPLLLGDLAGHFTDFDVIDEAEARRLLESMPT